MKSIQFLSPIHFDEYALLDVGDFQKLERFGKIITIRPEPQAVWKPKWDIKTWRSKAHLEFSQTSSYAGNWKKLRSDAPDQWTIRYPLGKDALVMNLSTTGFKHVGIFPEQATNWDFIYAHLAKMTSPTFLNLFAYTGGASLAAKAAGADVVHVDSVRQVVGWARQNMESSKLDNIRWTVEDALKFIQREVRRGKKYQGIIMDPPAYGIGAQGERWKLEEQINELVAASAQLLDQEHHVYILNCYSLGFSSLVVQNLLGTYFPKVKNLEAGELFLPSETGFKLPLGVFGRFYSI